MKKFAYLILVIVLFVSLGNALAALPVTSGLVMHLEADSITGVSDGEPIATWSDESGAGNDATQTNAAEQPVYVAANPGFKGHATVRFDGTDDYMELPSTTCNVGSFTMFAVAKYDHMDNNQYIVAAQDGGGDDRMRFQLDTLIGGEPPQFLWRAGSSAWKDIITDADLDVHVFGETSDVEGFLDGVSINTSPNTSTESPTAFNIGSYNRGEKDFFSGELAESIVFNRVLTSTEITDMSDYLALKYVRAVEDPVVNQVANGATVDVTFEWNAAPDPANPDQTDPLVKKHYLWVSNSTADPNFVHEETITVTDWSSRAVTSNVVTRDYDQSLLWQVEEGVDDGEGGTYGPGDPNNYLGPIWSFDTLLSVPAIDPQPQNTLFAQGDPNVVLTLTAATGFPPLTYQWYKDASPISDGAEYQGTQTDTLVILMPDLGDEGSYYCKVTANNGGITDSDIAIVKKKRMLARYEFEQNADDSVGTNNGIEKNGLTYTSDVLVTLDGQAYAADPNGGSYVELPLDAYPTVGFGNGLQEGSISFWVKLDPAMTARQSVFGTLNDTDDTALQIEAPYTADGLIRVYFRDSDGDAIDSRTGETDLLNNEWHYVVTNIQTAADGSSVTIYYDGEEGGNGTSASGFADLTAFEFPMTLLARNSRGVINQQCLGAVDDLQIYNYALTVEEIAQTYYDVTGKVSCVLDYEDYWDVSGPESVPDCVVNLYDFAEMVAAWLDSGLYPIVP